MFGHCPVTNSFEDSIMPNIGTFNTAIREADETVEPLSFTYNDQEFFLADTVPMLPFMRLAKLGASGAGAEDAEAIGVMWQLLKACLRDDGEYERFEKAASRESGEVIFAICEAVIEGMMSRPTSSSDDSSAGPSKSGKSSNKPSGRAVSRKNVSNVELPEEDSEND
jgi:hypothetical protein